MNCLFKVKKGTPLANLVPFKHILYAAMLSNVKTIEDGDTRYAIYAGEQDDLYDYFADWDSDDDRRSEVLKAIDELADEGLISFDDDGNVYLGEFRGKKFFPFEVKNSLVDMALETIQKELKRYGSSKSAKDKSRSRYIREQIDRLVDKGIDTLRPIDLTDLHGYLYEVYTGGEIYLIRNKVEHYQTNNMLKAYDRQTTFALIVEATLHYDEYRKRGVPTLTNVACMKDDVFRALTKPSEGSKDYMREITSSVSEDSEF